MWQIDIKRQRGMGKWGWLFTVVFVVFLGASTLRLGPHYVDFEMIKGVFDRLPAGSVHSTMSRQEIHDHFARQFRIENFDLAVRDIVKVERGREDTVVRVSYEIREPLLYNADVILKFSEERTFQ